MGTGSVSGQAVTLVQIATIFSGYPEVRRPVIDKTGLSGTFDLHVESSPALLADPTPDSAHVSNPQADTRPNVFTAMQDQLGLKLDSSRGPVEVLIIDQATRPTPN
jgi:uncharacterized protein (TIGR03435 family)